MYNLNANKHRSYNVTFVFRDLFLCVPVHSVSLFPSPWMGELGGHRDRSLKTSEDACIRAINVMIYLDAVAIVLFNHSIRF